MPSSYNLRYNPENNKESTRVCETNKPCFVCKNWTKHPAKKNAGRKRVPVNQDVQENLGANPRSRSNSPSIHRRSVTNSPERARNNGLDMSLTLSHEMPLDLFNNSHLGPLGQNLGGSRHSLLNSSDPELQRELDDFAMNAFGDRPSTFNNDLLPEPNEFGGGFDQGFDDDNGERRREQPTDLDINWSDIFQRATADLPTPNSQPIVQQYEGHGCGGFNGSNLGNEVSSDVDLFDNEEENPLTKKRKNELAVSEDNRNFPVAADLNISSREPSSPLQPQSSPIVDQERLEDLQLNVKDLDLLNRAHVRNFGEQFEFVLEMKTVKEILEYFQKHQMHIMSASGTDLRQTLYDRLATLMNLSLSQVRQFVEVYVSDSTKPEFRKVLEEMLSTYYQRQPEERTVFLRYLMQTVSFDWITKTESANLFREIGLFRPNLLVGALRAFDMSSRTKLRSQAIEWFAGVSGGNSDFADNMVKLLFIKSDYTNIQARRIAERYSIVSMRMIVHSLLFINNRNRTESILGHINKALMSKDEELTRGQAQALLMSLVMTLRNLENSELEYKNALRDAIVKILNEYYGLLTVKKAKVEEPEVLALWLEHIISNLENPSKPRFNFSIPYEYIATGGKYAAALALVAVVVGVCNGGTLSAPLHMVNPNL